MVNYEVLGYGSINEYSIDFVDTLLMSNHTYDFFIDWVKVFNNLEKHLVEISILNALNKVSEDSVEIKFREIIKDYPQVVPILPSILAIRVLKTPVFDMDTKKIQIINFSKNSFDIEEIVNFSKKTGLLDLFNKIDDLYSYLVGAEVGLDTNARKNRSGHIFEDIVGNLLEEKIEGLKNYKLVKEDPNVSIKRNKRFDYVIYENNLPKFAFECNFYNSTGSKPIEVAHAYVELQKELDEQGITFVWVTDGNGWKKMFTTLMGVASDIEFIINYNQLNDKFKNLLDDSFKNSGNFNSKINKGKIFKQSKF